MQYRRSGHGRLGKAIIYSAKFRWSAAYSSKSLSTSQPASKPFKQQGIVHDSLVRHPVSQTQGRTGVHSNASLQAGLQNIQLRRPKLPQASLPSYPASTHQLLPITPMHFVNKAGQLAAMPAANLALPLQNPNFPCATGIRFRNVEMAAPDLIQQLMQTDSVRSYSRL